MVTISDVADHCGVNVSTVSRVLNGNKRISEETAELVRAAVKELGYTPLRRTRRTKAKSDEITLVMPNPSLYTLGSTLREMSLTLYETDFDIRIVNLHQVREITPEIAKRLCRKKTAGIILYGCIVGEDAAEVFYQENVPTVVEQGSTSHLVSVCVNNYNGMRDAAEYVVSRGYKRIGFIGWEPSDYNIKTRFDSYSHVLGEAGLDDSVSAWDVLNLQGGYNATRRLLDSNDVEALMYATDIMAYGGIKYLNERGISYPQDIGIMGFDDAYLTEILNLTSMYQLLPENAKLVVENLMWMIENNTVAEAKEVLLTPRLVVRGSLR